MDRSSRVAPLLWTLLAFFVLRVLGQVLVAFWHVRFLPPMEEWFSGLLPYRFLLAAQLAIIFLLAKICLDYTRRSGVFFTPQRFLATSWFYFGVAYLVAMVARYPLHMYRHPEARWFHGTIPIFFHWVLASFVIVVGWDHRRRRVDP